MLVVASYTGLPMRAEVAPTERPFCRAPDRLFRNSSTVVLLATVCAVVDRKDANPIVAAALDWSDPVPLIMPEIVWLALDA